MSAKKKSPGGTPEKSRKGYGIWLGAIVFISAWTFLLGVLVGRGTAPVHFDTEKLQKELIALREAVLQKDAAELQEGSRSVRFHEALKEDPAPKPAIRKPVPKPMPPPKPPPVPAVKKVEAEKPPGAAPEKKAAPKPPEPAATPPEQLNRPFSVQVAAVKEARQADKMVEDLQRKGYPAYKSIVKIPDKGIWFRVRIGSFESKEKAGEMITRLKKDDLKGIVVTR